jgi:lipopolysaccharide heptosyltransferase II
MDAIIVNPFGIGDVLFTMPLVGVLRERFPKASIGYWCNQKVRELLQNNSKINVVFGLSRGDLKRQSRIRGMRLLFGLWRQIKRGHFDLAFDFALDHRYTLLLRLAGIKRIIGFGYKKRGRFLSQRIDIQGFRDRHVAEHYLETLKFLNIHPQTQPRMEVFSSSENDSWASDFLKKQNLSQDKLLIAVCPAGGESWGENGRYLRWPEDKFAHLCDELITKTKATILLFGSSKEAGICNRVEASMKNKVLNISAKLSLGQFIALLKKCAIAICNDTGPLHMSVGLGIKTLCLAGPVDEQVYGPYPINEHNVVIKKDLACRPCYKNFRFPGCNYNHECLQGISVDEVFIAAEKLIAS